MKKSVQLCHAIFRHYFSVRGSWMCKNCVFPVSDLINKIMLEYRINNSYFRLRAIIPKPEPKYKLSSNKRGQTIQWAIQISQQIDFASAKRGNSCASEWCYVISDWLRKWRKFFKPITDRGDSKPGKTDASNNVSRYQEWMKGERGNPS